jgi:signal transduction histidine kinase
VVNGAPYCTVIVQDEGIGFDSRYAERIFQPFHRLHSRSKFDGTGMGLSICRRIVERHGGQIRAESELGQGSRFLVTLALEQLIPSDSLQSKYILPLPEKAAAEEQPYAIS